MGEIVNYFQGLFLFENLFDEMVALLLVATVVGIVAVKLRQPLLLGFIAVGILVGPSGFNLVKSNDQIHLLGEVGLAVLLFLVGLRLDLQHIKSMGVIALFTGIAQMLFSLAGGFGIAYAFGASTSTALFVATACMFSSTIVVIKMLSDKKDSDSLYGRLSVGVLIVQDLAVILIMIALSVFSGDTSAGLPVTIAVVAIKAVVFLVSIYLLSFYVLPKLLGLLARSIELFVLFGIAWALFLAAFGELLGFSKEVGAFLAGVSLASSQYRDTLGSRLFTLRDFLLLFFFLELGTDFDLSSIGSQVWKALPLSIFVILGKPFIITFLLGKLGYRKRTAFLSGLSLSQISEFSLILGALGVKLGYIESPELGLLTLIALVTITASTYLIDRSQKIYEKMAPIVGFFERKGGYREEQDVDVEAHAKPDVILFGLGGYGSNIAQGLEARKRYVVGVDFDPHAIRQWRNSGKTAIFGDAEDADFPSMLPLAEVKWVISSIRDPEVNRTLVTSLAAHGYTGHVALAARDGEDAREFERNGVDLTFVPMKDASVEAVDLLVDMEEQIERKHMDSIIANMKDHYIVCGYGRMGKEIVKDLRARNMPVVVVEDNPVQFPRLQEHAVPYVEGNASEDEVLLAAGVERATGVIAVAPTDEDNVFICLSARGLNPDLYIVARSILEENEAKLIRAGADRVTSPYIHGGRKIATAVLKPRVADFLDLVSYSNKSGVEVGDILITKDSQFAGKKIADIGVREKCGLMIVAVKRSVDELFPNPDIDFEVKVGDELIVLGTPEQVAMAEKMMCYDIEE